MAHPCIVCNIYITNSDTAINCDICERWNHLYCGTGISMESYRAMSRNEGEVHWRCRHCDASTSEDLEQINQPGDIIELDTLSRIHVQEEARVGIQRIPGIYIYIYQYYVYTYIDL